MATSFTTFKYMLDFKCLGGDCEDTCCKSWDIWLDRPHFELLQEKVTSHSKDESAVFTKYVEVNDSESASDRNYAHINLKDNGDCPFLESDGWCRLHKTFGEAPLSNICAYYPRVLSQCGNDIELSGALSCPEMVRKCLLGEDSFEEVEFKPDILPRPDDYPLTRELSLPTNEPYYDNFIAVRNLLTQMMKLEGFSFESRFYFLSSFSNRVKAYYSEASEQGDSRQLTEEIKKALKAADLKKQDDYVNQFDSADPVAIIVIQSVLQLRIQQFPNENTSILASKIFEKYGDVITVAEQSGDLHEALPPESLWENFKENKELVNNCFQKQLDEYFSRFLMNCLHREWYITMPDLFTYLHMLTIRLAVLRFLIYSHPDILQIAESLNEDAAKASDSDINKLNKIVVDVVYNYSRAIDHNMLFLKVVYDAMNEQQMMTFEYSLPFIKF